MVRFQCISRNSYVCAFPFIVLAAIYVSGHFKESASFGDMTHTMAVQVKQCWNDTEYHVVFTSQR